MRETHDPILRDFAMIFNTFDPFPDEDNLMAEWRTDFPPDRPLKHYSLLPGGRVAGVRFYFKGRNRVIAYGKASQEVDLLRFADMATVHFWKYGYRNKHRGPEDSDMNFSVENAVRDLTDFQSDRIEVIQLLEEVERHFLSIGVLVDKDAVGPAVAVNPRKSKTARAEYLACHRVQLNLAEQRHQETLDSLAAVHEVMGLTVSREHFDAEMKQLQFKIDNLTTQLGEMAKRLLDYEPRNTSPPVVDYPVTAALNPEWETATHGFTEIPECIREASVIVAPETFERTVDHPVPELGPELAKLIPKEDQQKIIDKLNSESPVKTYEQMMEPAKFPEDAGETLRTPLPGAPDWLPT